jgi:hypothetical protein
MPPSVQKPSGSKASFAVSLHIQHRSGCTIRRSIVAHNALHAARAIIRQHGFTILEAYAAATTPGGNQAARSAWHKAEAAAQNIWHRTAPEGCPRWPALRLAVAVRQ